MRIFVYEYTCATGALPALQTEGRAMLDAITRDLRVAGMRPIMLLADTSRYQADADCQRLDPHQEERAFRNLAARADGCLVIAPEIGGLLAERCRWVEQSGGRLLGPSAGVVEFVGDKARLGAHFAERGVPCPRLLQLVTHGQSLPSLGARDFPVLVKPRRGAGAQATCRADSERQLAEILPKAQAMLPDEDFLIQSSVAGVSASVAFLVGTHGIVPLLPGLQSVTSSRWVSYRGGTIPLSPVLAERAVDLGRRAIAAVPGLLGYVGVDLVLGETAERDTVIELNPRLTTSYLGLRRLARFNLAEAIVGIAQGTLVAAPAWRPGRVVFRKDGTVEDSDGDGSA